MLFISASFSWWLTVMLVSRKFLHYFNISYRSASGSCIHWWCVVLPLSVWNMYVFVWPVVNRDLRCYCYRTIFHIVRVRCAWHWSGGESRCNPVGCIAFCSDNISAAEGVGLLPPTQHRSLWCQAFQYPPHNQVSSCDRPLQQSSVEFCFVLFAFYVISVPTVHLFMNLCSHCCTNSSKCHICHDDILENRSCRISALSANGYELEQFRSPTVLIWSLTYK